MDASTILKTFNDHFIDFLEDVHKVFPDNSTILTAKNILTATRKANPKLLIKIWKEYIVLKYKEQVLNGDISFFIEKDYNKEVSSLSSSSSMIIDKIDMLREPIRNMGKENQDKCIKYMQNLTKLAELYN
jgi:hypothetical protein